MYLKIKFLSSSVKLKRWLAKTFLGKGKPIMILLHSEMGYGVDFMTGTHKWHGKAPSTEQLQEALIQLEEALGDY